MLTVPDPGEAAGDVIVLTTADTADDTPASIIIEPTLGNLAVHWPGVGRVSTASYYVFQTLEMVKLYCDTVISARNGMPVFVGVLNHRSDPLMLLPLVIERERGARVLRFIDGGLVDVNGPILFPPTANWNAKHASVIWAALKRSLHFDLAVFDKMPREIGDLLNPLMHLQTAVPDNACHLMTLPSSWAQYETRRPRRIARNRLRLGAKAKIEFVIAKDASQYSALIQVFARQKSRRHLEVHGADPLGRPGHREFVKEAHRLCSPEGPVRLFALKANETVIATALVIVSATRLYYFMPSFEGGHWANYSPGHLLIDQMIKWAIENGIEIFDFGIGNETYKAEYCDNNLRLYRVNISSTARGYVSLGLYRLVNAARRRVRLRSRVRVVRSLWKRPRG